MRKRAPALFPKTRQEILARALMDPERWWYLSDLARHLGTAPSALQRELERLVIIGVLRRRKDGNRVYFQANRECPYFAELQGLMVKTAGLVDVLRGALGPAAGRIRTAFVYGSFARAEEHAASDVDVLVIGDAELAELAPLLRKAEQRLGRAVNVSVYGQQEFGRQRAAGNHFLESILTGNKLFIIGDELNLEAAG